MYQNANKSHSNLKAVLSCYTDFKLCSSQQLVCFGFTTKMEHKICNTLTLTLTLTLTEFISDNNNRITQM